MAVILSIFNHFTQTIRKSQTRLTAVTVIVKTDLRLLEIDGSFYLLRKKHVPQAELTSCQVLVTVRRLLGPLSEARFLR